MRVFVCEYVTGGGFCGEDLPPGLRREGDLMVAALVKDLAGVPGLEVTVARDRRLPDPLLPADLAWLDGADEPWRFWRSCIDGMDAVWPIAPETDGALERVSRLAIDRGRVLVGSAPEAVRLTASKLATARHLATCGIRVIPTWPADAAETGQFDQGCVLKPDDGAGCEQTFLLSDPAATSRAVPAGDLGRFVLQPFLPGTPVSLSLLCRDGEVELLSCNSQRISCRDGVFKYEGGVVGGMEDRRAALEPLAAAVARAVPGLWGHVGVDLIDGSDGPVVVEINPRLTTSYVGLSEALGGNVAARVLALRDRPPPAPAGRVRPMAVEIEVRHG